MRSMRPQTAIIGKAAKTARKSQLSSITKGIISMNGLPVLKNSDCLENEASGRYHGV